MRIARKVVLELLRGGGAAAAIGFQTRGGKQRVLACGNRGERARDAQIRFYRAADIAFHERALCAQRHGLRAQWSGWGEYERGIDALAGDQHALRSELRAGLPEQR